MNKVFHGVWILKQCGWNVGQSEKDGTWWAQKQGKKEYLVFKNGLVYHYTFDNQERLVYFYRGLLRDFLVIYDDTVLIAKTVFD